MKLTPDTGLPVIAPSSDFVYALDPGEDDRAVLFVLSTKTRALKQIDVGSDATLAGVDAETGVLYVVSRKLHEREGYLHLIRGDSIEKTVTLAFKPEIVSVLPGGRAAYVVGESFAGRKFHETEASRVDLQGGTAAAPVHISVTSPNVVRVTPDESRLVVLHGNDEHCCSITFTDLRQGKELTRFNVGSRGVRIASALASAALTGASFAAAHSAARASGSSSFTYFVFTPSTAGVSSGPLVIRPDGRFAYALDSQTSYVTVADAESGKRTETIRVGGTARELDLLANGATLAAVGDDNLVLIDTQRNQQSGDAKLMGDVTDIAQSPDARFFVVLGQQRVVVVDATAGKVVTIIDSIRHPTEIMFLN